MLRHLHQMVPAAGPVKRKRKAEHHRHSSSTSLCKKPAPPRHELDLSFERACSLQGQGLPSDDGSRPRAVAAGAVDSPRLGDINGSNFQCPGDLCFVAVEEETTSTDDDSEFSSMDGRSSPSHPAVSWGPASREGAPGFVQATAECFQTPLGVGFATPRANGVVVETPGAGAAAVSTRGRRVCSSTGESTGGASCLYMAPQQQQQQQIYASQEQQHEHNQGLGKRQQVRDGGRLDADVWGWFVDAGEEQPSRANANVQNGGGGVRYY